MAYPPEPWDLRGQMHASIFLVPLDRVPVELPSGCRPVRIGRRGVVSTAWVVYEPGGVLSYREIMATLLVRRGLRLMPTIVRIWVDSESSRDGGRALWGIPKDLATFDIGPAGLSARDEKGAIADGTVRRRFTLPGRWPVSFSIAQQLEGATKISPVRTRATLELATAVLEADPTGPLGFVADHRPLLSITLRDFRMSFGGAR